MTTTRDRLLQEASELRQKADLTAEDCARVEQIVEEVAKADAEAAAREQATKRLADLVDRAPHAKQAAADAVERHARTFGNAFVESSAWKAFREQHAAGFSSQHDVVDVYVRDLAKTVAKATVLSRPSATTGGSAFHLNSVVDSEMMIRQGALLAAVTQSDTTSSVLPYRALTALTPGPAVVPEATADNGQNAAGGVKPLGAVTTRAETATISTVAEGLPVTNAEIADDEVMISLVDDVLYQLVMQKVESEIISGDGTQDRPRGIVGASGVQNQAFETDAPTSIRKARTLLGDAASRASVVLNPADAEKLDLLQDKQGRFLGSGLFGNGDAKVWRMPVIESTQVPEKTAIVGDLSAYEVRWRERYAARLFNQHSDYAIRNLSLLLGETRFLGVFRRRKDIVVTKVAA